jgi:hypothetical protein
MSTLEPAVAAADQTAATAWRYVVSLRLAEDGPELLQVELTADALDDLHSQHWFDGSLRRGLVDVEMHDIGFQLHPKLRARGPRCEGFVGESTNRLGELLRREYPLAVFDDTVLALVQQQIEQGAMHANQTYYYDVLADRRPAASSRAGEPFSISIKRSPLVCVTLPLEGLVERAKSIGTMRDEDYPVLFTPRALARAETSARRGATQVPAVESGALLIGVLAHCPATGKMFAIVHEALPALGAREEKFSLTFTGETWTRIQSIVAARRQRTPATCVLGQSHGHPFLPLGGAPPCEACAKVAVCGRTNVHVSIDDRQWMRAVMPRQPWQLCFIFGLNARGEQVQELFGLHDNFLRPRGYWVLDQADADRLEHAFDQPPAATAAGRGPRP